MAVMRNSITFGGVNSADFGIYISGEGVFDAPKRAVEMVSVPGRNGEIAIDQGHYENIEVVYPAFNYESTMDDFVERLSDFRNAIVSQIGYQRLSDTFHPDEYRMALYTEGLEIAPIMYNTAAKFELKFNCKPQRFLTSGEEAVAVTNRQVVTNPTQYEAMPLLEVEGQGNVQIGEKKISIAREPMGLIVVGDAMLQQTDSFTVTIDDSYLETGDSIEIPSMSLSQAITKRTTLQKFEAVTITSSTNSVAYSGGSESRQTLVVSPSPNIKLVYGTSSTNSASAVFRVRMVEGTSTTTTTNHTISLTLTYDGASEIAVDVAYSRVGAGPYDSAQIYTTSGVITADSTYIPTEAIYVDLEIGEAWAISEGQTVDANSSVSLGVVLPMLSPGANIISFDNTITSLKVTPRWWKL